MQRSLFVCALPLLVGCFGDDVVYDQPEGGNQDGSPDGTIQPPNDGGPDAFDATSEAPPRLLLTQVAGAAGELAAFNPSTGMVDGRLAYVGFGTTQGSSAGPFLLETGIDVVARLDRDQPWLVKSTWSVAMNDAFDGGEAYADPVQVIVTAPNKAYVLRYNRNRIAIIDPSQTVEAGVPTSSVDLSSLLQGSDKDGHIDMSGAIYDPVRKRLYVALANIDLGNVDPQGFFQLCAQPARTSTLVAIDTTNDSIVSLGGSGMGGGVLLQGISPQIAALGGVVFDAAGDRVLVMSTGCNDKGDGGPGPLHGRLVEAVSLSTNQTAILLDASAQDFPGQLVFVDPTHAIVSFGFGAFSSTFLWDPSTTTLGPKLDVTPELFDYDRKGAILGPRTITVDGGKQVQVISVPTSAADAGFQILGTEPFTKHGDYFGNATYH